MGAVLEKPQRPNYNPDFRVENPVHAGQLCPNCGSTNTEPYQYVSSYRGKVTQTWRLHCGDCGAVTEPNEVKP